MSEHRKRPRTGRSTHNEVHGDVNGGAVFMADKIHVHQERGSGPWETLGRKVLRRLPPDSPEETLGRLRALVAQQWAARPLNPDLLLQHPIRLRWRSTRRDVEKAYSGAESASAGPLRGALVVTDEGQSSARTLVQAFLRMSRRQLVVLGPPGAGKSTLAVLFTRAMLENPGRDSPVPVYLSVAGWNPRERLDRWCARRIVEDYPGLAGSRGPLLEQVAELLVSRRVVPVLDGLDEMSPDRRKAALDGLDRAGASGLRTVVTCRSDEFGAAVQTHGTLAHAAVLDVEPVRAEDAVEYLHQMQERRESGHRWAPVLAAMREDPAGPVALALSTPLMITMAGVVYRPLDTAPGELTGFATSKDIRKRLLERYVPVKYADDDHERAHRWLSFLAYHLKEQVGSPNFEWWNLARALPRWQLLFLIVLTSTVLNSVLSGMALGLFSVNPASSLMYGETEDLTLSLGLVVGAATGFVTGMLGGLRTLRAFSPSRKPEPVRPGSASLGNMLADVRTLFLAFFAMLALVFVTVLLFAGNENASEIFELICFALSFLGLPGVVVTAVLPLVVLVAIGVVSAVGVLLLYLLFPPLVLIGFFGFRANRPKRGTPVLRRLFPGVAAGVAFALFAMSPAYAALALLLGEYVFPLVLVGFLSVFVGVPVGIARWLSAPSDKDELSSPESVLRSDHRALLGSALPIPALMFVLFTILLPVFGGFDPVLFLVVVLTVAEVALSLVAMIVMGSGSAWTAYTVARLWLALRGSLPWRLTRFLREAERERDVLREVGAAYQIRHELLRTHLAGEWASALRSARLRPLPGRRGVHRGAGWMRILVEHRRYAVLVAFALFAAFIVVLGSRPCAAVAADAGRLDLVAPGSLPPVAAGLCGPRLLGF